VSWASCGGAVPQVPGSRGSEAAAAPSASVLRGEERADGGRRSAVGKGAVEREAERGAEWAIPGRPNRQAQGAGRKWSPALRQEECVTGCEGQGVGRPGERQGEGRGCPVPTQGEKGERKEADRRTQETKASGDQRREAPETRRWAGAQKVPRPEPREEESRGWPAGNSGKNPGGARGVGKNRRTARQL